MSVFALVDCNNFFVSCERVFRPDLEGKPIAVLSNNDGCIIARSEELKKLMIPMCAPIFKYKEEIRKHNVHLFSANFSLYGDMSHRVMNTLRDFTDRLEVYSIDESFLSLNHVDSGKVTDYVRTMQKTVQQHVGIPVSIGVAPTKILAKLANLISKRHDEYSGVLNFFTVKNLDEILHRTDISDLWGVGRKSSKFLYSQKIHTALQLKNASDHWIKKHMGVVGQRIVWELRGISCLTLEDVHDAKKGILSSRSFGRSVETLTELEEAISTYTSRAAEKLRQEESFASCIHVWIVTNRFKPEEKQYSNSYTFSFPESTSYTPLLIQYAKECLHNIYAPGFKYKKASVMLTGLVPENQKQIHMFETQGDSDKQKKLSKIVDSLNLKYGGGTMRFAAEGIEKSWYMKSSQRSPSYTSRWSELPRVK